MLMLFDFCCYSASKSTWLRGQWHHIIHYRHMAYANFLDQLSPDDKRLLICNVFNTIRLVLNHNINGTC